MERTRGIGPADDSAAWRQRALRKLADTACGSAAGLYTRPRGCRAAFGHDRSDRPERRWIGRLRAMIVLLCGGAVLAGFPSAAPAAELLERVVAVVDEEPILLSEVSAAFQIAAKGLGIDLGDTAMVRRLRDQVLEQQIDQRVLFLEAEQREIPVDAAEIIAAVDEAIARNREEIGSEQLFQLQLEREGLTEEGLRQRYAEQAKLELLASRLVRMELGGEITVSSAEVRAYYQEHRDDLPQRHAGFHLQHILIQVQADSLLVTKARDLAAEVAGQIRTGAISFADAARRYSDDPNGREGGDLHRVSRGDFRGRLGEPFEDVVFSAEPDRVSDPLASPLGYHLVLVHEKDPDGTWVHASHILFGVPIMQADRARAEARAEELWRRARAGEAFEILAERYSDDPESRARGGDLGWIPGQALGAAVLEAVDTLQVGAVSRPVRADEGFHVFRVLGREAEREFSFNEIEAELTEWVRNQKMEDRYSEWIEELKQRHYIERRTWGED